MSNRAHPAELPRCKCCGTAARFFAQYDSARTCMDGKGAVFPATGTMVPYHQCPDCRFIFTSYFDHWSAPEFAERIYNSDYVLADPDFAGPRPLYIAGQLARMLGSLKTSTTLLDYGGGEGRLIAQLKTHGFGPCRVFDPFFCADARPDTQFDLVTAFEVVEHATDPLFSFRDALSFTAPKGALLFSTSLQNRSTGPAWWYIAPRNGHVSIHSYASLGRLAASLNVKYLSLDDDLHVFFRDPQSPIVRRLGEGQRNAALYSATKRGVRPFISAACGFAELGFPQRLADLRHLARALLYSSKPG